MGMVGLAAVLQQPCQMQQQFERTGEQTFHPSPQQPSPLQQQHLPLQHHNSVSGTSAPTGNADLFSFRSPHLSVLVPTNVESSVSDVGPDSVHSVSNVFGWNDAVSTPNPTKVDPLPETHHSDVWQLHTDMEGVTIGDNPITGDAALQWPCVDEDMPFMDSSCSLPERRVSNIADVIERDRMDVNSMLGMELGELKVQTVPEGGDCWDRYPH